MNSRFFPIHDLAKASVPFFGYVTLFLCRYNAITRQRHSDYWRRGSRKHASLLWLEAQFRLVTNIRGLNCHKILVARHRVWLMVRTDGVFGFKSHLHYPLDT